MKRLRFDYVQTTMYFEYHEHSAGLPHKTSCNETSEEPYINNLADLELNIRSNTVTILRFCYACRSDGDIIQDFFAKHSDKYYCQRRNGSFHYSGWCKIYNLDHIRDSGFYEIRNNPLFLFKIEYNGIKLKSSKMSLDTFKQSIKSGTVIFSFTHSVHEQIEDYALKQGLKMVVLYTDRDNTKYYSFQPIYSIKKAVHKTTC